MDTPTDQNKLLLDDERYRSCTLCPRECGVNRTDGRAGACGETAECRVASACPHFGEEPVISGRRGSGTVFFTGCACRCFFCQNHQISHGGLGESADIERWANRLERLVERGVHNLNFVTPDHFLPHVERIAALLRQRGVAVPFVYNGSGYVHPETVPQIVELFDVFLPDFKFFDPDLAEECIGDRRYPELALEGLRQMVYAAGFLTPWRTDGAETARCGVLVRHLVLPDAVENSVELLHCLYREFGPGLPLSVMSQFRPMPECVLRDRLARPLHRDEYETVCYTLEALGFEHVFLQDLNDDEGFVPDFRQARDPFPGNPAEHDRTASAS